MEEAPSLTKQSYRLRALHGFVLSMLLCSQRVPIPVRLVVGIFMVDGVIEQFMGANSALSELLMTKGDEWTSREQRLKCAAVRVKVVLSMMTGAVAPFLIKELAQLLAPCLIRCEGSARPALH